MTPPGFPPRKPRPFRFPAPRPHIHYKQVIKPNYTVVPHYVVPSAEIVYNPYIPYFHHGGKAEPIPKGVGEKDIYGPIEKSEAEKGEDEEAKAKEVQAARQENTPRETHHSGWSHPYHPSNHFPMGNLYHNT